MIFISVCYDDVECRVFLHGFMEAHEQLGLNVILEKLSAILGAPDDMIFMLIGGMIEMLDSHVPTIPSSCLPMAVDTPPPSGGYYTQRDAAYGRGSCKEKVNSRQLCRLLRRD